MNLVPPPWILELPTAARHSMVVGGELALLLFGFVLIRLALGFVAQRIAASPSFSGHQTKARAGFRVFGAVILALFVLAVLAVLAFNVLILVSGEDILSGTLDRISRLPPDFAWIMATGFGQAVGIVVGAMVLVLALRRILRAIHKRVRAWERLTANDAAVDAFFGLLGTVAAITVWLAALGLLAGLLPRGNVLTAAIFGALRLYLIFAVGLLLVRAVAAIVDSLDALSSRFAGPQTPFRFYNDVRGLVPLLRRCLEFAIWVAAASLMLLQIAAMAPFAGYGPRLIQVIGIFFLARVGAEVVTLVVQRTQGDRPGLTELERQQRATLVPLVASLGRTAVYFVAVVLMLSVLGFNPIPLLAGAGILGVVVGFGAQPVINDLVSGFFVLAESQFLVGDYIEVGAARGTVEAINLRTTKIRDPNGQLHIVRNGQLAGVVNYSKQYTFAVVEVDLPYTADLDQATEALRHVGVRLGEENPNILESTIIDGVERFGPSGVVIRTTTRVKPGTHGQVAREYRRLAIEGLRDAGLAPLPLRTSA